jgi:hypothetical protein
MPDTRNEALIEAGNEQADLLLDAAREPGRVDAVINALVDLHLAARQRGETRATDVQPITLPGGRVSEGALAVADELLVWDVTAHDPPGTTNAEAAARVLRASGQGVAVEDLVTPRVRRLRLDAAATREEGADQLAKAVELLTLEGFRVSFDHGVIDNAAESIFRPLLPFMTAKGAAPPVPPAGFVLPTRPPVAAGLDRVKVAIIDTGAECQRDDPDLWRSDGWLREVSGADDAATESFEPDVHLTPGAGHGSLVAGIVELVAPDAEVRSFAPLFLGLGSEVAVASAIHDAVEWGAQVINLSLGAPSLPQHAPLALEDALDHVPHDVLVVGAAGNSASHALHFPAAFKRVIAVAATGPDFRPAAYSNRGFWVDVSTRGTGIGAPFTQGTVDVVGRDGQVSGTASFAGTDPIAAVTGTSFAAPQVAGRLAQLIAGGCPPAAALAKLTEGAELEPDFGAVVRLLDQ